jgi:predicted nucleic acid-binding protein
MAVLVDTSVLIDYLAGRNSAAARTFQVVLDDQIPFGINSFIYQEVLQGVKSEADFENVKKYLDTQTFYALADPRESCSAAAQLYFRCRRKGITLSSTIDCLIIQTAIENDLYLLHKDHDFDSARKAIAFKVYPLIE